MADHMVILDLDLKSITSKSTVFQKEEVISNGSKVILPKEENENFLYNNRV